MLCTKDHYWENLSSFNVYFLSQREQADTHHSWEKFVLGTADLFTPKIKAK